MNAARTGEAVHTGHATLGVSPEPARALHVPERSCVACRGRFPQAQLHRFRPGEAGWQLHLSHAPGRSLYVCASPACHLEKKLRRAFREQAPAIAAQLRALEPTPTPE